MCILSHTFSWKKWKAEPSHQTISPANIQKGFLLFQIVKFCVDFIVVCVVRLSTHFQHAVIMWNKKLLKWFSLFKWLLQFHLLLILQSKKWTKRTMKREYKVKWKSKAEYHLNEWMKIVNVNDVYTQWEWVGVKVDEEQENVQESGHSDIATVWKHVMRNSNRSFYFSEYSIVQLKFTSFGQEI